MLWPGVCELKQACAHSPQATNGLGGRVDPARVVLWGTSYSGGHALAAASLLGHNVSAVSAFPFLVLCEALLLM